MNKVFLIFISLVFVIKIFAQKNNSLPQLGKNPVKEVIAVMTLEEKTKLVSGMSGMLEEAHADSTVWLNKYKSIEGSSAITYPIPRLGIPKMTFSDGPAGVRLDTIKNDDSSKKYYATAFPVGTLLASSWDTLLVKKVAMAFGNEVHEYGIDVILAPGMNIQRNPLGGRNFEYYSEDPVLSGNIAAAFVKGIQSNGVGTSIKHFAANNQETNRLEASSDISQRALREIYLKNFEIAVKTSNPWTVMSSYNRLNGFYTSENKDLITTILKDEWQYKGMVMSDWGAGTDPVAQQNAGNNLLMPGDDGQSVTIANAVKNNKLDEKILNENVERILNLILLSPSFKKYSYSNNPDLKAHERIAREGADESMVLLKNNNALPFSSIKKIALFGSTSYNNITGGTGSGGVNKAHNISLDYALRYEEYEIDKDLQTKYKTDIDSAIKKAGKKYSPVWRILSVKERNFDAEQLLSEANTQDIAIITIGRNSGEGYDRKEKDFYLSNDELNLIKTVSTAFHSKNKKVVVVLNISNPVEVVSWRDEVDAILLAWQPGQEGGFSITDILSGKINPSGKLAITFPASYNDVPSAKIFPAEPPSDSMPAHVLYKEGIYVGYRYYNTFHIKPAYEFGYGLSYTNFQYSNLTLSSSSFNKKITAKITITNTGKSAGKEVVQLYISAPAKQLDKPESELKAFAKTRLLKPGEKQIITFTINAKDLCSFDERSSSWISEAGKYYVRIGASSLNIKQTATFQLQKEMVVEKVHDVLSPPALFQELKNVK